MATIQPPPPPGRTGNVQVDAYLEHLYRWAYTFWFYQTGNGTGTAFDSAVGIQIPGLDGEPGEDGPMGIPGPAGPRGAPGLMIPGMDGQDADDWQMPMPVKAPDSYRLEGSTWEAPPPIGATPNTINGTTVSATTGAAVGGATAGAGGVAFPATAVAVADVNTLDDYEEGTWTPIPTPGAGTFTTVGTVAGIYTKIGRVVTATGRVTITDIGTGTGQLDIAGLPFTAGSPTNISYFTGSGIQSASFKSLAMWLTPGGTSVSMWHYDQSSPLASGQGALFTIEYIV